MPTRLLTTPAMIVAGLMIGHQVAAKAVRDSGFLSAWPATALPAMVFATAIVVVAAVPIYSWLLSRFSPRVVVPVGFLLSATAHVLEWRIAGNSPWVAVAVYLHVAGFGALLLSGFWSLVSELFDPATARQSFGRIAAAGTFGGLAGGLAIAQSAKGMGDASPLLMLATLHGLCGLGGIWLGRMPGTFSRVRADETASGWFGFRAMRDAPHLKTLAAMVVLSTAGAAMVDYVLKSEAAKPEHFGSRAELLEFFAIFYTAIQLITFLAQTAVTPSVRRLGLGRTMSTLPGGLGMSSALALLYPSFPMFAFARGVESVLRGSFFRSAYELLFVPMDPDEKRRTKTFLDVTCDRAGDAVGAGVVQLVLFTAVDYQRGQLLALSIATAGAGLWLARRLDKLYLGVVERHLVKQGDFAPIVVGSETGWTVIDLPTSLKEVAAARATSRPAVAPTLHDDDPRWRNLVDLRSGDRARVEAALSRLSRPDTLQIVQVVHLLAWDDMVPHARKALEPHASRHVGLLVDELLDPETDFAIRRRIPRILGAVASERALSGLVRGLDDSRFEVRYQCGRTMDRLLRRTEGLEVDPHRIWTVIDRELSVPAQVWHGYQLIDRLEREDDSGTVPIVAERGQRNLEHVFTLFSAVLPREPLQVAYHGIQSDDAGLRSLAIEYLDGVLPSSVRTKLWALLDAKPDIQRAPIGPEKALEQLRQTQAQISQVHLPKPRT